MEQTNDQVSKKYEEFETKYSVEASLETQFKRHVSQNCGMTSFFYCEGSDEYYTRRGTNRFKRFRHASFPLGLKKEVTTKIKPDGAKNNLSRVEKNLIVTDNENELIRSTIMDDGYEPDFTIWKSCHIYSNAEVTLVFYCVVDITPETKFNEEYFVEIEVDEELIDHISTEEAKGLIRKYETLMAPLGINYHKRLDKSLYERYTRIGK